MIAAEAIAKRFCEIPVALNSLHLGKLFTFICDIKLSHAKTFSDLDIVRETAEKSLDILIRSPEKSNRTLQSLMSANLYLAVALKAQDKKEDAFRVTYRAKRDLRKHFDADYLDEILITRQEILMKEDNKEFSKLLDMVPRYLDVSPHEAYASVKRVFERCLNLGWINQAEKLLPVMTESFRHSADKLSPLAKVSFQKNLGHFYLMNGEKKRAKRMLSRAYYQANFLGFHGQKTQISNLLIELDGNKMPTLQSFTFKSE